MATNRVLLGNRASGGYGLYVSKPTPDVIISITDMVHSTIF